MANLLKNKSIDGGTLIELDKKIEVKVLALF